MKYDETIIFLNTIKDKLREPQSVEFLYDIFIELTVIKSDLHKLIHFCDDDYDRKLYLSSIELANSLQIVTGEKISETQKMKLENIRCDYETERKYIQNDLEKFVNQSVLFKEFSKEILSNRQFSLINNLARHCSELNMKTRDYIKERMFKETDWYNE